MQKFVEVDGCTIHTVAVVCNTLPMDILLGTDVAELDSLLRKRALLNEFRPLFSNKPGRTGLVKHCIDTGTAQPIRLPPYRIP